MQLCIYRYFIALCLKVKHVCLPFFLPCRTDGQERKKFSACRSAQRYASQLFNNFKWQQQDQHSGCRLDLFMSNIRNWWRIISCECRPSVIVCVCVSVLYRYVIFNLGFDFFPTTSGGGCQHLKRVFNLCIFKNKWKIGCLVYDIEWGLVFWKSNINVENQLEF